MSRLYVIALSSLASLAAPLAADAQSLFEQLEPPNNSPFLDLEAPLIGAPGPSQRIRIRNGGSDPRFVFFDGISSNFVFTGPSTTTVLAPGDEVFWDISCRPLASGEIFGGFDLTWCSEGCEPVDTPLMYALSCRGGSLDWDAYTFAPGSPMPLALVFPDESGARTATVPNATGAPLTITGAQASAGFTAAIGGGVPQTIAPGATVDVDIAATGGQSSGTIEVLSAGGIVSRVTANTSTLADRVPAFRTFEAVPLGAIHTRPFRIRNASAVARTITSATFDSPIFTVSKIVGRTLAPGEKLAATVKMNATALGSHNADLTIGFDSGPDIQFSASARVADATFSVTGQDSTPTDGRLDFGTAVSGAAPIDRTITITNTGPNINVFGCGQPDAPFKVISPCPSVIPANSSVTLTVRFTPRVLGEFHAETDVALPNPLRGFSLFFDARVVAPAFAIGPSVPDAADAADGGGCSASGDPALALIALALVLGAVRRRRSA